jgi:hypothetical protein
LGFSGAAFRTQFGAAIAFVVGAADEILLGRAHVDQAEPAYRPISDGTVRFVLFVEAKPIAVFEAIFDLHQPISPFVPAAGHDFAFVEPMASFWGDLSLLSGQPRARALLEPAELLSIGWASSLSNRMDFFGKALKSFPFRCGLSSPPAACSSGHSHTTHREARRRFCSGRFSTRL